MGIMLEGRESDLDKIEQLLSKKVPTMVIVYIDTDQLQSMETLEIHPERRKEMLLILEQDHVKIIWMDLWVVLAIAT